MMPAPALDVDGDELGVVAVRFAHRGSARRPEHFYRAHDCADEAMPIDYFVWLIAGRGHAVLVDAGFTREVAIRRGARDFLASPLETIEQLGVPASRIDHLVLTHLHYDHTGFVTELRGARLWLQRREWEYWRSRYARRGDDPHLIEAQDHAAIAGLMERDGLVDGDVEVVPGVRALLVGGHTAGLQVVAVDTPRGRLVIASDASHFYDNIYDDRPYAIVHHLPSMYDAFDRVLAEAGSISRVIPGHDPDVLRQFPAVEGFEGLVARLA